MRFHPKPPTNWRPARWEYGPSIWHWGPVWLWCTDLSWPDNLKCLWQYNITDQLPGTLQGRSCVCGWNPPVKLYLRPGRAFDRLWDLHAASDGDCPLLRDEEGNAVRVGRLGYQHKDGSVVEYP